MRILHYIFAILFLSACNNSNNKIKDTVSSTEDSRADDTLKARIEYTFHVPNDTTKNFYVTVYPDGEIKGTLILLSGFGELPAETLIDTDIYKYASQSGYITFIPALGDRLFFYCDTASQRVLHQFIDSVFEKYNLPGDNFFIGGYSLGGFAAFQYTEHAYTPGSTLKKPAAVFGADPPLDLERIYKSMTSTDRPPKYPGAIEGEKMFTDLFQSTFKTNPRDNPQYFWNISAFSLSDSTHRTIRPLVKVPLRIYNDPDINWYIQNRFVDYTDLNVLDGAATVNWLRSMGNKHAELINCLGKGYKRNARAPHSWSIIDGKELVAWMNSIAQETKMLNE